MNHNKEAKSLTFWRGSEVSLVLLCKTLSQTTVLSPKPQHCKPLLYPGTNPKPQHPQILNRKNGSKMLLTNRQKVLVEEEDRSQPKGVNAPGRGGGAL